MDYNSFSDEELIDISRDSDENERDKIVDFLIRKYRGLVEQQVSSLYVLGGDREDLVQEGTMGLFKAIRDYDPGRDASFATFAHLCISRQIYTAVQASGRKKHLPLNTALSLNAALSEPSGSDDKNAGFYSDIVSNTASMESNPEEQYIASESIKVLSEQIDEVLSSFEKQVLDLYLTGMNYVDIAHVLGRTEKSTDNAIQRIRTKIKRLVAGRDK